MTQIYSAISSISPASQKTLRDTLSSTLKFSLDTEPKNLTTSLLFSVANETAASSSQSSDNFAVHPFILNLASKGFHVPLTLFTTEATKTFFTREAFISHKPVFSRSTTGTKCHIMDITAFPAEKDMDIGDWHEAWTRYQLFVEAHSETSIAARWKNHFQFLLGQDHFKLNFPAILQFDIEMRTAYAVAPKPFNEDNYRRRYDAIKLEVLQNSVLNARARDMGASHSHNSSKGSRFTLYSLDDHGASTSSSARSDQPHSSGGQSFRANGAASRSGPRSAPMCLICQ